MRQERGPAAFSSNKLGILGQLHRRGPATPGELAEAEHQQPQSLTRVFAELERAGLITRRRDERDRRQAVLDLTSEGRRALEAEMAERDLWLERSLATLTDTEREVLRLAAGLMERLADRPDNDL